MKAGWALKTVGEVADHCLGKMLDKNKNKGTPKPYLRNLNVRWFGFDLGDVLQMKFEDGEADRYSLRWGDVAVCEGGYPGRAAIWENDEAIFIQKAIHRVRFHEPERARWFVYYLSFCDATGTLKNHFTGSGIQHFTGQALAKFPIPLPPLEEQRRIVATLDEAFEGLDRARANAEANLASARELFARKVSALFGSHENSRLVRLGDLVTRLTNGYVGPTRNIYVDKGIPYLLARHVRDNILAFDGRTYVSGEFNEKHRKSKLKTGDVVIVQSGHIGHCAEIPPEHDGHNCHAMIVATPKSQMVSGTYLSEVFNTPAMQGQFQAIRSGSTVPHLTCKMVKELKIPVIPVEQQMALVDRIQALRSETRNLNTRYGDSVSAISDLRQSLLQKAFAGELT